MMLLHYFGSKKKNLSTNDTLLKRTTNARTHSNLLFLSLRAYLISRYYYIGPLASLNHDPKSQIGLKLRIPIQECMLFCHVSQFLSLHFNNTEICNFIETDLSNLQVFTLYDRYHSYFFLNFNSTEISYFEEIDLSIFACIIQSYGFVFNTLFFPVISKIISLGVPRDGSYPINMSYSVIITYTMHYKFVFF